MNHIFKIFIAVLMAFQVSAESTTDNSYRIGDTTTSEKTIVLGGGGQNIIRVPSGGGNLEISNDGGAGFNEISAGEQANEPDSIENGAILTSVSASALTIDLKQSDASTDATASTPVRVGMRVAPLTSGAYNSRTVTAALTLVVPSGATLGHTDGDDGFVYVYLLDNAGTLELAASSVIKDEAILQTSQTIGGGSDDDDLYSTTGRASVPIRLIARLKSNQVTAGTWDLNMSEIAPGSRAMAPAVVSVKSDPLEFYVADVANSGTPAISTDFSGSGASWIDSLTDLGVGTTRLNLAADLFDGSRNVLCTCNTQSNNLVCILTGVGTTTVTANTTVGNTAALIDTAFIVHCAGSQ